MQSPLPSILLLLAVLTFTERVAAAQEANYDESKVPSYTLPDPLILSDGTPVATAEQWTERGRPETLDLFREHVYGHTPSARVTTDFVVTEQNEAALNGLATRKQVTVTAKGNGKEAQFSILLYVPNRAARPVPLVVALNFKGNHTIVHDPGIYLPAGASDDERGSRQHRWPVRDILKRGYALATVYYEDIVPDESRPFAEGIFPLFYEPGQTKPAPHEWGAIGAWAWGMSRVLDYAETDDAVNAGRAIALGHSRLGKTALWAGAQDERFAIVVSNNSGCGGAALSRRRFGETVARINTAFPHWFCDCFKQYNDNESALPVDQHQLIGLIAPRPVYVASAEEDQWADPRGEFLAAKHAGPVYALLGEDGLPVDTMPPVNEPVHGTIGYHVRAGGHDLTAYDWTQFLDFADYHFGRR